jgi:hypothetical protein
MIRLHTLFRVTDCGASLDIAVKLETKESALSAAILFVMPYRNIPPN